MTRKDICTRNHNALAGTGPGGEAARQVVVLPIGSVEDHGPAPALGCRHFLIWSICGAGAQQAEGDILLMPIIPFVTKTHHMDFPGHHRSNPESASIFVLDVTKVSPTTASGGFSSRTDTVPICRFSTLSRAARSWKRRHCARLSVAVTRAQGDPAVGESGRAAVARMRTRDFPSICILTPTGFRWTRRVKERRANPLRTSSGMISPTRAHPHDGLLDSVFQSRE